LKLSTLWDKGAGGAFDAPARAAADVGIAMAAASGGARSGLLTSPSYPTSWRRLPEPSTKDRLPHNRGFIALLDPPDAIRSKIRAAVTGSSKGYGERNGSPGIDNLVTIMAAVRGVEVSEVISRCEGMRYEEFKNELADVLIEFLAPIQRRYAQIRQDETALRSVFEEGAARARDRALVTLARAHEAVGLV
jgi:tryptophanyl-tRNA synthetase